MLAVFVKLSLGAYKGTEAELKNIYVRRVRIKNKEKLSFTYHYKTRDIIKNYVLSEGASKIRDYMQNGFCAATLYTTECDMVLDINNAGKAKLKKAPASNTQLLSSDHNREKKRLIAAEGKSYLHVLGVTDAAGNVLKNSQDKYRQINKYVEILDGLIKDMPTGNPIKVLDMGSGKGYLTFALYDHMVNTLGFAAELVGVEQRADMVALCNKIAGDSGFEKLHFVQSSIENFDSAGTTILIALHACDIATDHAIYKGISAQAELIVAAPCCHKQIRRQIEKNKVNNALDFLMKHGIFVERQAEMVTDGLRAMMLEYQGYSTKVFEFISDAHTPKNVMIVATRNKHYHASKKSSDSPEDKNNEILFWN